MQLFESLAKNLIILVTSFPFLGNPQECQSQIFIGGALPLYFPSIEGISKKGGYYGGGVIKYLIDSM